MKLAALSDINWTSPSARQPRAPFTPRRAGPNDAHSLAALFRLAYKDSSHPFQTVAGVTKFLAQAHNFQIVAEEGSDVVASMAMTYNAWNDSYELGRALTHPEYRRHGVAAWLIQQVVDWVAEAHLGELIFGFPRVRRVVDLCAALRPQMIVTGHDAGRNVANGNRETHLIVCGIPNYARFVHAAPRVPDLLAWPFLVEEIYAPLGLRASPGDYPNHSFIGEVPANARELGGWIADYAEASGALEIVGRRSPINPLDISSELAFLLARFPRAQHVTITVLADKTRIIHALVECGFELTAYLPAWYKLGQYRYDCVQLAKRRYAGRPGAQDFKEDLDNLESKFRPSPYLQPLGTRQFATSDSSI